MIISYYDFWLNEEDEKEIESVCDGVVVEYKRKKAGVMNAALDELFPDILLSFNSPEVQAVSTAIDLAVFIVGIISKIRSVVKQKKVSKVTPKTCEKKEANILVEVDNVKILLPEDSTIFSLEEYIALALNLATTKDIPPEEELIISFENNTLRAESISIYAERKFSEKTKGEDDASFEKLEQTIVSAILNAEKIKIEQEKEKIRNTKISKFTKATISVLCVLALFFVVVSFYTFLNYEGVLTDRIIKSSKIFFIATLYIFMAFVSYALGKNKDKNFTFNLLSILLAFIPVVFTIVS